MNTPKYIPIPLLDVHHFLSYVDITEGCWEWRTDSAPRIYGRYRLGDDLFFAHRVSYTHWVGKIPKGMQIDHLCRNRACVNPNHLEAVTPEENMRRALPFIDPNHRKPYFGIRRAPSKPRAVATHCKRGHELPPHVPRVPRPCRPCMRIAERAYERRNRAARVEATRLRRSKIRSKV